MSKLDQVEWAVDCLRSRMDAAERPTSRRVDPSRTGTEERKWKIRGRYPNGSKLEFSVLAFDYSDAKKKAESRKGGAQITDIVLQE